MKEILVVTRGLRGLRKCRRGETLEISERLAFLVAAVRHLGLCKKQIELFEGNIRCFKNRTCPIGPIKKFGNGNQKSVKLGYKTSD